MKIVVTGGSGHTGTAVVDYLVTHKYSVAIIDQVTPQRKDIPYKICDLLDYGQVIDCLENADAIVHLAAIPRPIFHPNTVVFKNNVLSTYNIFEAASVLKIPRIIYASSISVTGYPFYSRFFEPQYLPIDEDHPPAPQDPYGLSKYIGEEIGKSYTRRSDMTVISLRMPWIHTPETFRKEILPHQNNPEFGASNLWAYVDSRDVGQAVNLSLQVDLAGFHPFFISAHDTFMETGSLDLVNAFYPGSQIRPGFSGQMSLINCDKACVVLHFKAVRSWKDYISWTREDS